MLRWLQQTTKTLHLTEKTKLKIIKTSGQVDMFKCRTSTKLAGLLLMAAALSALSGCGKSSDVVTQDDSAEYHNAISLPPLKKPSRDSSNGNEVARSVADKPVIIAPKVVAATVVPDANEPTKAPVIATPEVAPVASPVLAKQASDSAKQNKAPVAIRSQVVDGESGTAQLLINAGFAGAWNYLSGNLQRSDITVHNRNQSAGTIAIGCAEMDQAVTVASPGRWSIFKRQPQKSEYCGLRLVAKSKSTLVQVLSRSGAEVLADDARSLFARLLNN